MRKNLKLICLITIFGIIVISGIFAYQRRQIKKTYVLPNEQTEQLPANLDESQTYINTEFGFEFQYPQDWVVRENTFVSYYSKFNLEIFTRIGESLDSTFLVNIVLPEFTERSFQGLEKTTSEIIIAGVQGIKYEYEYHGFPHTVVILPFGELRMILATGDGSKQYLDEFNQTLTSFKFLNK